MVSIIPPHQQDGGPAPFSTGPPPFRIAIANNYTPVRHAR